MVRAKKMSESDWSFQKRRGKRISESYKWIHDSHMETEGGVSTFGQRVKKAWKNIDEIKPK